MKRAKSVGKHKRKVSRAVILNMWVTTPHRCYISDTYIVIRNSIKITIMNQQQDNFTVGGYRNRNRIKGPQSWKGWEPLL